MQIYTHIDIYLLFRDVFQLCRFAYLDFVYVFKQKKGNMKKVIGANEKEYQQITSAHRTGLCGGDSAGKPVKVAMAVSCGSH